LTKWLRANVVKAIVLPRTRSSRPAPTTAVNAVIAGRTLAMMRSGVRRTLVVDFALPETERWCHGHPASRHEHLNSPVANR
jgi:hypothetical protein